MPSNVNLNRTTPFPSDWTGSQDRVRKAFENKAQDGVIDGGEAQSLVDQFKGSPDEYLFRYGLNNVVSDRPVAYTRPYLPEGAKLTPEARDIFEKNKGWP